MKKLMLLSTTLLLFILLLSSCQMRVSQETPADEPGINQLSESAMARSIALFDGKGRIGFSADGNQHDSDDWGATPLSLAIMAKAKLQSKVVHYSYSDHIWDSNEHARKMMTESAYNGAAKLGFNQSRFFDCTRNLEGALNNLKNEINKSSASNPLYLILAGPMEVAWRGINRSQASKRQYVTCISHSYWNDNHAKKDHGGHDWNDLGKLGVKLKHITDQNARLGKQSSMNNWAWLKTHGPAYQWVYSRIDAVYTTGDASDAGMAFFLLTNNQKASVTDLKNWFASQDGTSTLVQAENYSSQGGIQKESCSEGGQNIGYINNNDFAAYNNVNFKTGMDTFVVRYASDTSGGTIEIRLGSKTGTKIGQISLGKTGSWQKWQSKSVSVNKTSGKRNVYLVFKGGSGYLFNINWFQFKD